MDKREIFLVYYLLLSVIATFGFVVFGFAFYNTFIK